MFERQHARQLHLELDQCHGACILRIAENRSVMKSALMFFHGVRCGCGDFVVMPNHVHWLVQPFEGHELEILLQTIKRYTSTQMTRLGRKTGKVWQKENYDHIIRNCRELESVRRYIAENPKKAGLTADAYSMFQASWSEI